MIPITPFIFPEAPHSIPGEVCIVSEIRSLWMQGWAYSGLGETATEDMNFMLESPDGHGYLISRIQQKWSLGVSKPGTQDWVADPYINSETASLESVVARLRYLVLEDAIGPDKV